MLEPIRIVSLPLTEVYYSDLVYDRRRALLVGRDEIMIVNLADDGVSRWSLVDLGQTRRSWQAFLIADGRELLLFDRFNRELHRFALPRP